MSGIVQVKFLLICRYYKKSYGDNKEGLILVTPRTSNEQDWLDHQRVLAY